ncbi:MAG: putative surface protein with fasciclin (FAS1) repeats [Ulvibacter sp.]|jgi:uncharacterized surface protein with fasciclin (FAS1) repeats
MNIIARFLFFIIISSAFFSCKNEGKSTIENVDNDSKESLIVPVSIPEKKELTTKLEDQVNSVMVKSMVTPDLKTFTSMLVTVGLVDMLSKQEGPFTIIGPSNEAFTRLGQFQLNELLNTANKDELIRLIKSHVIEGNLDSTTLVQKIKEGKGSYEIVSMSGTTYTVSREGTEIFITDVKGVAAQIGKSDVKAANGVLHLLDKVLGMN